jgi:hypothetical protein
LTRERQSRGQPADAAADDQDRLAFPIIHASMFSTGILLSPLSNGERESEKLLHAIKAALRPGGTLFPLPLRERVPERSEGG